MQLDPQEKSHAWWQGTLKGAVKGLLWGLAIVAASALMLHFVLIPLLPMIGLPSIAHAFGGFLTLAPELATSFVGGTAASITGTGVVAASAFSVIPLAIFSGVSGMIAGLVNSGAQAIEALHQRKHFDWQQQQDARLSELDGREHAIEETLAPARATQKILAQGPRIGASFAQAETDRANAPSTPTIQ